MLVGLGIMLGFMQINHSLTQISEISPASWPQLMASKLIGKLLRKQSAWFYVPFSTRNVDIGNQSTVGLWVSKTKKLRSPCLRGGLWPRRPRPFFFFFCENILAVGAAQADDTCVASWKLTFIIKQPQEKFAILSKLYPITLCRRLTVNGTHSNIYGLHTGSRFPQKMDPCNPCSRVSESFDSMFWTCLVSI